MAQIASIKPNGLTVASLFSGCGGSCLGFRMAGFRVVYANEFVPAARDTYRANHPTTPLDPDDVRNVTAKTIRNRAETALESSGGVEIDVLEGSPPCAAFSTAGSREAGWGEIRDYSDTRQRTDDLFMQYARILNELRPRAFVAENVIGLVRGVARGFFLDALDAFRACGYRVGCRVLDAQWLGVPQARLRLIFVGVREDLGKGPVYPYPLPYRYTVAEVLPYIRAIKLTGSIDNWQSAARPFPTITTRSAATNMHAYFSAAFVETVEGERRRLTIDEVKLLSGFPDDFILTGTFEQQWERMGRAVPPPMMRAVAETLRDQVL